MAKRVEITRQEIEKAKSEGFSESERKSATRQLARLKNKPCNYYIDSDAETLELYCAIRKTKQHGDASSDVRISAELLRYWKNEAFVVSEDVIDYYVVPK